MAMHSIRDKMENMLRKGAKPGTQPQLPAKPEKPKDKLLSMGYERGEELGRGSFGYAIKVRRQQDGRIYVAKLQKYNQMDAEERERLLAVLRQHNARKRSEDGPEAAPETTPATTPATETAPDAGEEKAAS